MKNRKILCAVFTAVFLLSAGQLFARGRSEPSGPVRGRIILATTTSTYDTGLLTYIMPVFTAETGWKADVISVGTGAALQLGRDGQADVLLVHALAQELQFVADGHGIERFDVMFNDFIIVGPAGFIAHNNDAGYTFRAIAARGLPFVSRGDNSGTHMMELNLWRNSGIQTENLANYISVGQGMGAALQMTNEMLAFTLTDRGTWLSQRQNMDLAVICELDPALLNLYGVIAVNPEKGPWINARGAQDFIIWILAPETQRLIAGFGLEEFGEPLFTPNAAAGN